MRVLACLVLVVLACATASAAINVRIVTSEGPIEAVLYDDKAPISVRNFIEYARSGHYDGTIYHRVIRNFMIQGGGFTPSLIERPTRSPIKNEAANGLKNERGTLAMARTSDVNSATSQFFINHADNSFLDHGGRDYGYCVFGRVTRGMEVVDRIAQMPTGPRGPFASDVPRENVIIEKVIVA